MSAVQNSEGRAKRLSHMACWLSPEVVLHRCRFNGTRSLLLGIVPLWILTATSRRAAGSALDGRSIIGKASSAYKRRDPGMAPFTVTELRSPATLVQTFLPDYTCPLKASPGPGVLAFSWTFLFEEQIRELFGGFLTLRFFRQKSALCSEA